MSGFIRTVKTEVRELIALRRDSVYHSIGRMAWGRHWYLYLVIILVIQNLFQMAQGYLFLSMMQDPGPYYNYIATGFSLMNGVIPFLLAFFVWGVLPFTRHQPIQAVDGLLQGGVHRFTIYRAFILHTMGAFFYLYLAEILVDNARGYIWNLLFTETVPHSFWQSVAPHSYAISINPDGYDGFLPLTFYRFIVCPLWDLMWHIPSYINSCLFPVLVVVFLAAYWKRRDIYFILRRLIYIGLFVWLVGLVFTGPIYLLIATENLEWYMKIQTYYFLFYQAVMWFVWIAIFRYVFKSVSKIDPFSKEAISDG